MLNCFDIRYCEVITQTATSINQYWSYKQTVTAMDELLHEANYLQQVEGEIEVFMIQWLIDLLIHKHNPQIAVPEWGISLSVFAGNRMI